MSNSGKELKQMGISGLMREFEISQKSKIELFSQKYVRNCIEIVNCFGFYLDNAFSTQYNQDSHRGVTYVKKSEIFYSLTVGAWVPITLLPNLLRTLHLNSSRFFYERGPFGVFSRSTRNNRRLYFSGVLKSRTLYKKYSIFLLRGLISNLCLQTKFYSSLRRPLHNYRRLA